MPEIEIVFTIIIENPLEEEDERTIEQKRQDKILLEKIKKYGAFNDQGEWTQE